MIDIMYPLGSGSQWQDNELRYSLRSVEKHLKNFRNVYVVGERPSWITNVRHVPLKEKWHPSRNIYQKVLRACMEADISPEFLFLNDDHFLLSDIDAAKYPFYHRGEMSEAIRKNTGNWYQDYVLETIGTLRRLNLPTFNYDLHCPVRYEKEKFLSIMPTFDWDKKLTVKSMYCNSIGTKSEYMPDCKIAGRIASWRLEKTIAGRHVFSISDRSLDPFPGENESAVKLKLQELFPNKSKYEL